MTDKKKPPIREIYLTKKRTGQYDGVTQKIMTFRCDFENVAFLKNFANKGRVINDAIRRFAFDYYETNPRLFGSTSEIIDTFDQEAARLQKEDREKPWYEKHPHL